MQFQTYGMRLSGWRVALIGLVGVLIVVLAIFLGAFLLVAGLVFSAGAALVYAIRRRLGWGVPANGEVHYAQAPESVAALEVREIQVDEVVVVKPADLP